jgi:protein CpxP
MYKKILSCLSLLAACLLVANVYAGKDGPACEGKGWHAHHAKHFMPLHKMTKKLDLSEDQQQQLKALHEENRPKLQAQHDAMRENRKQMHELITSGAHTEDQAAQLAEQHGALAAEMARLRAAEMAGLYALLTPEQKEEFSAMKFERKKHRSEDGKPKEG